MRILPNYFLSRTPELAHKEFREVQRSVIRFKLRAYRRSQGENFTISGLISELTDFANGLGFSSDHRDIVTTRGQSYKKIARQDRKRDKHYSPAPQLPSQIHKFLEAPKIPREIGSAKHGHGLGKDMCSLVRDFLIWREYLSENDLENAGKGFQSAFSLVEEFQPVNGETFDPAHRLPDGSYSFVRLFCVDERVYMKELFFEKIAAALYRIVMNSRSYDTLEVRECENIHELRHIQADDEKVTSGWLISVETTIFGGLVKGNDKVSNLISIKVSADGNSICICISEDNSKEKPIHFREDEKFIDYKSINMFKFEEFRSKFFSKIHIIGGTRRKNLLEEINIEKKYFEKMATQEEKELLQLLKRINNYSDDSWSKSEDQLEDVGGIIGAVRKAADMVRAGTPITLKDENGWNALHYAIVRQNFPILNAVIERGTEGNKTDFLAQVDRGRWGYPPEQLRPFDLMERRLEDAPELYIARELPKVEKYIQALYDLALEQAKACGMSLRELNGVPEPKDPDGNDVA